MNMHGYFPCVFCPKCSRFSNVTCGPRDNFLRLYAGVVSIWKHFNTHCSETWAQQLLLNSLSTQTIQTSNSNQSFYLIFFWNWKFKNLNSYHEKKHQKPHPNAPSQHNKRLIWAPSTQNLETNFFTLKTHQILFVHTTPEDFGFVYAWGKLGQVNHMIVVTPSFSKRKIGSYLV